MPQWRPLRLGSQGAAAGGGGIQKLATPGGMDEVSIFLKSEWQNQPSDLPTKKRNLEGLEQEETIGQYFILSA